MRRIFPFMLLTALAGVVSCTSAGDSGRAGKRDPVSLLYVHTAASGTLTPIAGKTATFRLTLSGAAPEVIYFSDRPQRLAGRVPFPAFVKAIGFGREAAPNAAIEIANADKSADVIVAALSNPAYDAQSGMLAYDIRVLTNAKNQKLAAWNGRADPSIAAQFGEVTLFIDDSACLSVSFQCNPTQNAVCCPGSFCQWITLPGSNQSAAEPPPQVQICGWSS